MNLKSDTDRDTSMIISSLNVSKSEESGYQTPDASISTADGSIKSDDKLIAESMSTIPMETVIENHMNDYGMYSGNKKFDSIGTSNGSLTGSEYSYLDIEMDKGQENRVLKVFPHKTVDAVKNLFGNDLGGVKAIVNNFEQNYTCSEIKGLGETNRRGNRVDVFVENDKNVRNVFNDRGLSDGMHVAEGLKENVELNYGNKDTVME